MLRGKLHASTFSTFTTFSTFLGVPALCIESLPLCTYHKRGRHNAAGYQQGVSRVPCAVRRHLECCEYADTFILTYCAESARPGHQHPCCSVMLGMSRPAVHHCIARTCVMLATILQCRHLNLLPRLERCSALPGGEEDRGMPGLPAIPLAPPWAEDEILNVICYVNKAGQQHNRQFDALVSVHPRLALLRPVLLLHQCYHLQQHAVMQVVECHVTHASRDHRPLRSSAQCRCLHAPTLAA